MSNERGGQLGGVLFAGPSVYPSCFPGVAIRKETASGISV